jgi:hypothetical protein
MVPNLPEKVNAGICCTVHIPRIANIPNFWEILRQIPWRCAGFFLKGIEPLVQKTIGASYRRQD